MRGMRKIFRRRELFSRHARIAVEAFGTAWVARSWLDPDWGGTGTWLWWLNLALSSAVVVAMFVLLATKPRKAPSFDEQLREYLKRHDYTLTTREMAARMNWLPHPLGRPVVASPFVPKGQFIAVNPDTLADVIKQSDPTQFRFTERVNFNPSRPVSAEILDVLGKMAEICSYRWGAEHDCSMSYPGHKCTQSVGLHGSKCVCACGATVAYELNADGKDVTETRFPLCGEKWQDPKGHCSDDDSGAGMHTCNRNAAHALRDDQHACRCGRNVVSK